MLLMLHILHAPLQRSCVLVALFHHRNTESACRVNIKPKCLKSCEVLFPAQTNGGDTVAQQHVFHTFRLFFSPLVLLFPITSFFPLRCQLNKNLFTRDLSYLCYVYVYDQGNVYMRCQREMMSAFSVYKRTVNHQEGAVQRHGHKIDAYIRSL